jgi:hypothetical protein
LPLLSKASRSSLPAVLCGLLCILAAFTSIAADDQQCFRTSDGRVEIKSQMKYELFLSMHVLRTAEDHHHLFIPWAQRMRASLSPETYRAATNLNGIIHEWQLCSLLQNYDGPQTIEGITDYISRDPEKVVARWISPRRKYLQQQFELEAPSVASFAKLLARYYAEGFGTNWPEHRKLIEQHAAADLRTFEQLPYSITTFMEQRTGRKFPAGTKLVFYPSSFSRPQHAYGFEERGNKVIVYKVGDSAVCTAFHELLHSLIEGWDKPRRMRNHIADLGKEPLFRKQVESLRDSYDYPNGCFEELIVHAVGNYLSVKAGLFSEAGARGQAYCGYQNALNDAIFARFDDFPLIDDFILHAITHIHVVNQDTNPVFKYVPEPADAPQQTQKRA